VLVLLVLVLLVLLVLPVLVNLLLKRIFGRYARQKRLARGHFEVSQHEQDDGRKLSCTFRGCGCILRMIVRQMWYSQILLT
jgi:hypothetical protein